MGEQIEHDLSGRPASGHLAALLHKKITAARRSRPAGSRGPATTVATGMTGARHQQVPGPRVAVIPWQAWPAVAQAARTRVACGPFGP